MSKDKENPIDSYWFKELNKKLDYLIKNPKGKRVLEGKSPDDMKKAWRNLTYQTKSPFGISTFILNTPYIFEIQIFLL